MLAQSHAKMSILNVHFGLSTPMMGKGGCFTGGGGPLHLCRIDSAKQFPNFINRHNSYVAPTMTLSPPPAPKTNNNQNTCNNKKKKKRRRRKKKKQQAVTSPVARQRHCSEDSVVIVFDEGPEESSLDSSCDSWLSSQKKVRFADDLCEVHKLVAWSFAYQAARKGNWEECARDRWRFNRRIKDTGDIITRVLDTGHRERIYEERFADMKVNGCDNYQ